MNGDWILVVLILIGLAGRSHIITTAACILLAIKLVELDRYLPSIERRGLELGLLFLTMAVLAPFAADKITFRDVAGVFISPPGIFALTGGAVAAYMNSKGLELLKIDPQIIVGLVLGSIFGIVFFKGIPVGPLMAAGITALLLKVFQAIFQRFH